MSLILRADQAAYMNTGTGSSAVWSRVGDGFTSFPESKNAKEYTRQYIHMRQEVTDVVGYAPSIAYSCDVYDDDPCCSKIVDITNTEAVGADAEVEILIVDLYKATGEGIAATAPARKRTYVVVPDQIADGVDALVYTGTLKAVSEITNGTFKPSDSTFTAAS